MRRFLVLALVTACDGNAPVVDGDYVHQISTDDRVWEERFLLILVVDDSPMTEAMTLRDALATRALPDTLAQFTLPRASGAWAPVDLHVVVVHPSAPEPLAGPFALVTPNASDDDIAALTDAVSAELYGHVARLDRPYPLLDQAVRAHRLLTRQRPPATDAEARLVAALPPPHAVYVAIATTRDDESTGDVPTVEDYSPLFETLLVVHDCGEGAAALPRLAAYAKGSNISSLCDYATHDDLLVTTEYFTDPCLGFSRPVLRDASGSAACRITFTAPVASCDPARGWADAPTLDSTGARRCEVLQAEGPNLEACLTSRGCPACTSAYCITEAPWCPGLVRFVGGALPFNVGGAHLTIACDLDQ